VKVVQLLPELHEGGVERGVVELNRELVRNGVESVVISAGGGLAALIAADGGTHITFDVCRKNPLTVPFRVMNLRRLLMKLKPDILHARSRVPAWLTRLANREMGIPFVTTVHGFNRVNAYSRVMTCGDRVICVSKAIQSYIQTHYRVPDERVVVIPRGVDLKRFDPDRIDQEFRRRFQARYRLKGHFVVTAIGRITPLKDYETFIRGVVAAATRMPDIHGLIVGGTRPDKHGYAASLRQLVTRLGAGKRISFCGSQTNIAEVYAVSDLVAVCSKKPESFGRTAAEALAMNVPVVASAHGGVLDIVLPGKTGELFPPQDADALAAAIIRARNLRRDGLRRHIADNFPLEGMTAATLALYRQLLASRRPTGETA
jgi:glycosyltransferase involved in cell wall biosynthesis